MAINVGDILASFRVIDEATEPLNQIAGAQEEVATTLNRLQSAYASAAGPVENWNKLAEEFSGMPLAERANDMASAVEAIGGATRLTQQEQTRVNAVMEETVRKYEALGLQAPPAIRDLAEATRDAAKATKEADEGTAGWAGSLASVAKAAAGLAIAKYVKDVINFTGELTDLSAQTGITVRDLQLLNDAGSQVGVGMGELAMSSMRMSRNLEEGNEKSLAALQKLGLSYTELQRLDPGKQFFAIAEAMRAVEGQGKLLSIGNDLMGRGFMRVLPLVKQDLDAAGKSAAFFGRIMGDDVVAAGDDAGDAMTRFWTAIKSATGQIIGPFLPALTLVVDWLGKIGGGVGIVVGGFMKFITTLGDLKGLLQVIGVMKIPLPEIPTAPTVTMNEAATALTLTEDGLKKAEKDLDDQIKKTNESRKQAAELIQKQNDAMSGQGQIAETRELIATYDRLAKQGITPTIEAQKALYASVQKSIAIMLEAGQKVPPSFLKIKDTTADAAKGLDRWSRESEIAHDEVWKLGRALDHELVPALQATTRWFNIGLLPAAVKTGGIFNEVGERIGELGKVLDENKRDWGEVDGLMSALGRVFDDLNSKVGQSIQVLSGFWKVMRDDLASTTTKVVAGLSAASEVVNQLVTGTGRLATATRGAFAGAAMGAAALGGLMAAGVVATSAVTLGVGAVVAGIAMMVIAWNAAGKAARAANREADAALEDLRARLLDTYGSIQQVDTMGQMLGVDLAGAWGDTTTAGLKHFSKLLDEFNAKLKTLSDAAQEFGFTWVDMRGEMAQFFSGKIGDELVNKFDLLVNAGIDVGDVTRRMSGEMNAYIQNAIRAGVKIPAAMEPIIRKMIELGLITKDTAALMLGLEVPNTLDWENALKTIEKYGGTLASLGPAFEAAKLAADWKSIGTDWEYLIGLGGDMGGILFSMKDEIGKLVAESVRLGTEIPENMRPLIEELIRTGQLVDENGEKITDISQLKFGAVALSDTEKLIAKLDELIAVLSRDLPAAFDGIGKIRVPEVEVPWRYQQKGGGPGDEEGGREGYASGTHGQFLDFGAGTNVTLHGRERVMTPGESGGGQPITITVISQLDGKEVARNQVRYLPSQLTLAGR